MIRENIDLWVGAFFAVATVVLLCFLGTSYKENKILRVKLVEVRESEARATKAREFWQKEALKKTRYGTRYKTVIIMREP